MIELSLLQNGKISIHWYCSEEQSNHFHFFVPFQKEKCSPRSQSFPLKSWEQVLSFKEFGTNSSSFL